MLTLFVRIQKKNLYLSPSHVLSYASLLISTVDKRFFMVMSSFEILMGARHLVFLKRFFSSSSLTWHANHVMLSSQKKNHVMLCYEKFLSTATSHTKRLQRQPLFLHLASCYSHRRKVWQVTVEWISPCQSIDCFLLESETINLSASAHLFFWNKASAELFRTSTVLGRVWYKEAMPLPERKLFWWKPVPCRSLLLLPNGKENMMSTWHYRLEVLETTCANHPFTPHVSG